MYLNPRFTVKQTGWRKRVSERLPVHKVPVPKKATWIEEDSKGTIYVKLYTTTIVTVYADGRIKLNTGGYRTVTTKTRMNQVAKELGLGYYVYQEKRRWFVDYTTSIGGQDWKEFPGYPNDSVIF